MAKKAEKSPKSGDNINLTIANRKYPFTLETLNDEKYFRKAETLINNKLKELNYQFLGSLDLQHSLVVVAVEALLDALRADENYEKLKENVLGRVEELEQEITIN